MTEQFTHESLSMEYELILEKRKTIALTVFPDQAVRVKAPMRATPDKIEAFLERKVRWILKQRRYFSTFKPIANREYVRSSMLKQEIQIVILGMF